MNMVRVLPLAAVVLFSACQEERAADPVAASDDALPAPSVTAPVIAEAQGQTAITCAYPVKSGDSAESLLERFEDDARQEEVMGAEGEMFEAVVLWPDDPARRVEVFFADEAMTQRGSLRLADETSEWTIGGLALGYALAEVENINGRAFGLYGFGWDYGGTVFDWNGGKLENLAGGCKTGAYFSFNDPDLVLPEDLLGDRALQSDMRLLRSIEPAIYDLWINYPGGRDPGT